MRQKTIRDAHFRALEAMYLSAPINQFYRPRIVISKEQVEIEIDIDQRFFHAAGAVHGMSMSSCSMMQRGLLRMFWNEKYLR